MPRSKPEPKLAFGKDGMYASGTHVRFAAYERSESGKTLVWHVVADRYVIGTVKWFGRWRRYGFFPGRDTVFEELCLREIAMFCEQITARHRASLRRRSGPEPDATSSNGH